MTELVNLRRFKNFLLPRHLRIADAVAVELLAINPSTRLLVISANTQIEIARQCEALGGTFIAKPLKAESLAKALETVSPQLDDVRDR